jgi:iron complex outermembrane receptor protein
MRNPIAGTLAGLAVSLIACPPCFGAQPADAVVIEATRFPEVARSLPASVTVLTAEDIAASPARTLPELLSQQAGITMRDFFGNNAATTSVDLRGFGVTGGQNTLILVDGRRITDIDLTSVQWSAIPLASIERVEIMRGTGAVLYGDGASSGVINIVTRSPLREGAAAEAWGRVGTFSTREGQIYGSAASGSFGANASVYGYASDGYRANNRNEQQNNTVNLRWELGKTLLALHLATDRQDLRLPGARRVQPSIGLDEYASDPRGAQTPARFREPRWRARRPHAQPALGRDRPFGRPRLAAQGPALVLRSERISDLARGCDGRDFAYAAHAHSVHHRRNRASPDRGHRLARLGLRFAPLRPAREHRSADQPRARRPGNARAVRAGLDRALAGDAAAARLARGARSLRRDRHGRSGCAGLLLQHGGAAGQQKQRASAWEAGLRHELSSAWSLYGRVGQAFRFVNVDEIYENDAFFSAQFQILNPQRSRTYEAGAEWRSNTLSLRAAYSART